MKFVCPHCGANAFRLLSGANGRPAAECSNCGKASAFDQSMSPEPPAEPGAPKPPDATK
jgi:transcription elongation factor Elf1